MPDSTPGQEQPAALTLDQLYDFFALEGKERHPDTVRDVPSVTLGGGVRRYLREQVITWAALGGLNNRRPVRATRMRPLIERDSA